MKPLSRVFRKVSLREDYHAHEVGAQEGTCGCDRFAGGLWGGAFWITTRKTRSQTRRPHNGGLLGQVGEAFCVDDQVWQIDGSSTPETRRHLLATRIGTPASQNEATQALGCSVWESAYRAVPLERHCHPDAVEQVITALSKARGVGLKNYAFGADLWLAAGNYDFAVVADLDGEDGFRAYQDHPDHRAALAIIAPMLADRVAVQFAL